MSAHPSAQLKSRSAAKTSEHIVAARKMLSSLPDMDSDSDDNFDSVLSDSGDDDPDLVCKKAPARSLQEKAPARYGRVCGGVQERIHANTLLHLPK